ncbi:MAG: RidA family protein, partial [Planctomycetota bacterium]
ATAAGVYRTTLAVGDLLFLSGHTGDKQNPAFLGRVGEDVDLETAPKAAAYVARQMLATVRAEVGLLDRVIGPVKVTGFVQVHPDFKQVSQVLNGFSEVLATAFGDHGCCPRTAVGVAALPANVCVEVEAIFRLHPDA